MQKVKELLQRISKKINTDVVLVIISNESFGLFKPNLELIFQLDNGYIEQELEKYLESCKK